MKRGFLFGLGWFLIISIIGVLGGAFAGSRLDRVTSVIVALICMPLSVVVIRSAKHAPPHHSRLHAIVGWLLGFLAIDAGLLTGAAAVALWGSGWNPFAPKDYEECAESAARTAKSKEALGILLSSCNSKFVGRRNPRGGYTYYDTRQDYQFDIAGPNPTPKEWKIIESMYSSYLELKADNEKQQVEEKRQAALAQIALETSRQQAQAEWERKKQVALAEIDRRRRLAVPKIELMASNIECAYAPTTCGVYKLTVRLRNNSNENITALGLGWVFVPLQDASCPNSLPTKKQEAVTLRPGDTTVLNIDGYDGPHSTQFRGCVKVSDVQIAPPQ
jgi:hypothetical protein